MTNNDDIFLQELLVTFREEAAEHLESIVAGLLELEKKPEPKRQQEVLEQVYRAVHSLKGAARAVNINDIETVCQSFEEPLAKIKAGELTPAPLHFDLFQQTVDLLTALLEKQPSVDADRIRKAVHSLGGLTKKQTPDGAGSSLDRSPPLISSESQPQSVSPLPTTSSPAPTTTDSGEDATSPSESNLKGEGTAMTTVRMATSRLDTLFRQAEEMLVIKLNAGQRVTNQRNELTAHAAWEQAWQKIAPQLQTVRSTLSSLDDKTGNAMARLIDFLDWNRQFMSSREKNAMALFLRLEEDHRAFTRMVDEHLDETKRALMLPFATLTSLFPKMVRDMGRAQGKEIVLTMDGTEIALDRRILEALKAPLLHLVRNSIDHGVEGAEERRRAGKPVESRIAIEVSQRESNKIEVAVRDDGRGIDRQSVLQAASKAEMLTAGGPGQQDFSDHDLLPLLLASGITTSRLVTEISGRGLGLAIVKENIEAIGGEIEMTTAPGEGTCFRLLLPAVLSSFKGVFIRCNGQLLAIPSQHVRQVARVHVTAIKTIENRETISFDSDVVSLVRMAAVLQTSSPVQQQACEVLPVVDLQAGNTRMAFMVDEILHEGEGLVKGLGKPLIRVRNIAGVTVLGSGELAPILNVGDLILSARQIIGSNIAVAMPARPETESVQHSILVADDSVTSRTLLKNILQSAGYLVTTTVDGQEAWATLMTDQYDAVVTDVEMPSLDGFELTTKIRANKEFADLPVVLVTSLDSRKDQERGIAVGANAYLKKSGFDQTSLLEILQRLL